MFSLYIKKLKHKCNQERKKAQFQENLVGSITKFLMLMMEI